MKNKKLWRSLATAIMIVGLASPTAGAADSLVASTLERNPGVQVVDPAFNSASSIVIVDSNARPTAVDDTSTQLGNSIAASGVSAGCPLLKAAFPSGYNWTESTNGCGIIGASKDAKYRYSWSKHNYFLNVASDSCVQGRGYYEYVTVGEPRWYNAGCGSGGEVVVNIGNRATVAKIRGKTMTTVPSAVYWR